MKLSFDGIRRNLACEYNELASTELSFDQRAVIRRMEQTIVGLLAAYDPRDQPGDCNMLADEIELVTLPEEDDAG